MINKQRGTQDLFFEKKAEIDFIASYCEYVATRRNYQKVETPAFEDIQVFLRKNDVSDLVTKELFDFKDKSNRHISLKPEGTAPIIRLVLENKLLLKEPLPLKLFYTDSFFRYERPQSGRLRQFHQFGIEKIGIETIYDQFEGIIIANEIITGLNLKNYTLKINYLGNSNARNKWINNLKTYFQKFKNQLTQDSINRLEKNPLRILDDKIDGQKDFVLKAPKIDQYLSIEEKNFLKEFLNLMNKHKIKYVFDNNLVRGLDYYSGIVFEYVSNESILQGQSTLIGGGSYENIIPNIANQKDCLSFGFALGLERLLIALKAAQFPFKENQIDIYIANLSKETIDEAFTIYRTLCIHGYKVDSLFNVQKLPKHFKKAEKEKAKIILIYGLEEFKKRTIKISNEVTKEKKEISLDKLDDLLIELKKQLKN